MSFLSVVDILSSLTLPSHLKPISNLSWNSTRYKWNNKDVEYLNDRNGIQEANFHFSSSLLDLKIQYSLKLVFINNIIFLCRELKVCKQLILESQYAFEVVIFFTPELQSISKTSEKSRLLDSWNSGNHTALSCIKVHPSMICKGIMLMGKIMFAFLSGAHTVLAWADTDVNILSKWNSSLPFGWGLEAKNTIRSAQPPLQVVIKCLWN